MHKMTTWRVGAAAIVMLASVAGCATSGSSGGNGSATGGGTTASSGATEESDSGAAATAVTTEKVSLTLAYTDDPPVTPLVEAFTAKYPNITIKLQQTPFGDYVKSIKLSMASNTPPDIAEYNPGAMRSLVPAGLIYDLTPYQDAYGWMSSFPASSLDVLRSNNEATQFGTGALYAVPGALSMVGTYYNKQLLENAGVTTVPATLADFESDMAKVKSAGIMPLTLGAQATNGLHLWAALVNSLGSVEEYRNWVYGAPGASIETQGAKDAATTMLKWANEGYVPEAANATDDSDALANFTSGKTAYMVTGNWAAGTIEKEMGDNVGFFPFPQGNGSADDIANGASVAFSISSKTEHPNEAAAFLNFMASPEAAKVQFDTGFMPVNTSADVAATGVRADIAQAFKAVTSHNGIVPFPDFAAPDMLDRLTSGVQGVISEKASAADYLTSLQQSWTQFHG